jgi:hypothetical protein
MAINTKRVTLAFDIGSHCQITNAQALWRTALCLLLTDRLAGAGRVFEVWVVSSGMEVFTNGPRTLYTGMCVKRSGEPLVLDRMCGMFSVGFLRTAFFCAWQCCQWTTTDHLGYPAHEGLPDELEQRRKGGEVVLRVGECLSKEAMLAEYKRAWEEVEKHSIENVHVA